MNEIAIDRILHERKVIITCGTGGDGKTTLSAAIAIRAALLGKKAVVVTIDPAKRLATSLGLDHLNDHASDLTPQIRAAYQKARPANSTLPADFTGSLAAIIPDTRRTFENFVNELAPNPAIAQQIIRNPIFQIFAKEFSGTNEYMALERLLSLHKKGDYDCIILDTPPSRNTLTFLNAPQLLAQFFEERMIRWIILPANKWLSTGMRKTLGILEQLTGAGFMTNFFDFVAAMFEVQINFQASLKKIMALLKSEQVGFLVVAAPAPTSLPEIQGFIETLHQRDFNFEGVALNRTLGYLRDLPGAANGVGPSFDIVRALQAREDWVIDHFKQQSIPLSARLPELSRDVHSVEDLLYVTLALDSSFFGHS